MPIIAHALTHNLNMHIQLSRDQNVFHLRPYYVCVCVISEGSGWYAVMRCRLVCTFLTHLCKINVLAHLFSRFHVRTLCVSKYLLTKLYNSRWAMFTEQYDIVLRRQHLFLFV